MGMFDLYPNQKIEKITSENRDANEKQLELLEILISQNNTIIANLQTIIDLQKETK